MPSSVPIVTLRLDPEIRAVAQYQAKRRGLTLNAYASLAIDALNRASVEAAPRHARNAPCVCGSGKKYKRCCGRSG